jgi:hypothetical protein
MDLGALLAALGWAAACVGGAAWYSERRIRLAVERLNQTGTLQPARARALPEQPDAELRIRRSIEDDRQARVKQGGKELFDLRRRRGIDTSLEACEEFVDTALREVEGGG